MNGADMLVRSNYLFTSFMDHPASLMRITLTSLLEYPNEVITLGGHLDSWDIGEGAHDDEIRL